MTDPTNKTIAENARTLATFLEAHPDLPTPTHLDVHRRAEIKWLIWDRGDYAEQKAIAAAVVRTIPGTAAKKIMGDWFHYSGTVEGVGWEVYCDREAVCTRVVTGTKTVTRTVPDPTIAVPSVEVTEEIETVEWRCEPLLAETAEQVSA